MASQSIFCHRRFVLLIEIGCGVARRVFGGEQRCHGDAREINIVIHGFAKTARVERDGEEVEVAVKELAPGDIMIVRPGDKIPTDGEVVEGESHLDESIATGESIPVYKSTGDSVIGATINKEGRLRVKATRVGGDTFLAQVVRLIDQAQNRGYRLPQGPVSSMVLQFRSRPLRI